MPLIGIHGVRIAFGGAPLLDGVSLSIDKGQRVCLLGRNGTGKSTLMRILSGETPPDAGDVVLSPGARVAHLPQDVPAGVSGRVEDIVAAGLVGTDGGLHEEHEWRVHSLVKRALSDTGLDGEADYAALSGGMRRRVFLAKALAREPDLLLLDEPTNHLDIQSIAWLEAFLVSSRLATLFITHDRRLLRRLATRIIELDRGHLSDWSCDYDTFLARRQAALDAEEKDWDRFDKRLAQEEVWIRKGIKARRCRDEGRVKALERMREERRKRRERTGVATMAISESERSGYRVVEALDASFSYGDKPVLTGLSIRITRGDRIGIVGPNGCGKSTLVNLLLGRVPPTSGVVERGAALAISYFDQLRDTLDLSKTVWGNLAPDGSDTVMVDGSPRHVISYLKDFLFTSDRARTPVNILSGGERNRLLLARLFAQPSNVLVFDEPTNDLDTETLELLEELLAAYKGTVLVVSHDREFLNNVVTSILAYDGGGVFVERVGGYDDWERWKASQTAAEPVKTAQSKTSTSKATTPGAKKLTFKERKDMATLPALIETKEREHEELNLRMADQTYFTKPGFLAEAKKKLAGLDADLAEAYRRWEELDARSGIE